MHSLPTPWLLACCPAAVVVAAGTPAAQHACILKRRQQLAEQGGRAGADQKGRFDEVVEDGGVRILIEPAALMHVIGTTMDFVEDRIKCPPPPPPPPGPSSARLLPAVLQLFFARR